VSELRSHGWFQAADPLARLIHRSWQRKDGTPAAMLDGRPVIGICNTWSELTPCNAGLRELAERVRRGVLEAGGYPVEFPVMSLGESLLRPTAMLYRNLASMDVEESIRGNPVDGVVLMCGCDKTTPALLMGAASCDLPTIVVSAGPMLTGHWEGRSLGSGRSVYAIADELREGGAPEHDAADLEASLSPSVGHCNSMGTASTMGCLAEALGIALAGNGSLPAVDARRQALAHEAGRRIVALVRARVRMSDILTRAAFANAIRVNAAIGGSTNAVVHLIAVARRIGAELSLGDFDALGDGVPLLADLLPSGRHLMEDFARAGGTSAVLAELGGLIDTSVPTVSGRTLGADIAGARVTDCAVIRPLDDPVRADAGIKVVSGSLAPDGAVIKPSAASAHLLRHSGPAVVFESPEDLAARVDDPAVGIDAASVMVLRNAGPRGFPGMPEVGKLRLPRRLAERGVTDLVRISDARMSGTAFGTVILHVAPEAAVGGPLALVRDGDEIALDVARRRLDLRVDQDELARRRASWRAPEPPDSGYERLYAQHVLQAPDGADFDFLVGCRGAAVPRGGFS
jgi:dihydroxy-acid dehydratase